jgi:hypothetical protein
MMSVEKTMKALLKGGRDNNGGQNNSKHLAKNKIIPVILSAFVSIVPLKIQTRDQNEIKCVCSPADC